VFSAHFKDFGGVITASEGYSSGTTDFKAQLTKIIAAAPDAIYIPAYDNDIGLITLQSRELGFKGVFLGSDGWDSEKTIELGKTAVEGAYFTNHFSKDDTRDVVKKFVAAYTKKFNVAPNTLAYLGYEGAGILFTAIKNANSKDAAKIVDALKNIHYQGIAGDITFDSNRNPLKSAIIIKIENGKQVYHSTVNP